MFNFVTFRLSDAGDIRVRFVATGGCVIFLPAVSIFLENNAFSSIIGAEVENLLIRFAS